MDYNEALIRTATLNGIVLVTFTPLLDLSEVVLSFLPADERPDRLQPQRDTGRVA